jgi:hypothetical protein
MPRKQKVTLKSVQAAFDAYSAAATKYIQQLRHPNTESFFSVKGYEKTKGRLKPNVINVPELLAIVGTANRLGKNITITTSGVELGGQVDVRFVDRPAELPTELRGY